MTARKESRAVPQRKIRLPATGKERIVINRKIAAILSVLSGALVLTTSAVAIPTVYPSGVTIHETGVSEGFVVFRGQDGQIHLIDVDGIERHTWAVSCGAAFLSRPLATGNILVESLSLIHI